MFSLIFKASSKLFQSVVQRSNLGTVPSLIFFLCWSGAQLRKLRVVSVSVGFWYHLQVIFLLISTWTVMSRKASSRFSFNFSMVNSRLLCNLLTLLSNLSGSSFTEQIISSTYLSNSFLFFQYHNPFNFYKAKKPKQHLSFYHIALLKYFGK